MTLNSGERQVAADLSGIRVDHVARYRWALTQMAPGSRVLDLGCGIGYGAFILAQAGHQVTALDVDREAIEYGRQHYAHPNLTFVCEGADFVAGFETGAFDSATCFEMIEHVADPLPIVRALGCAAGVVLASVPNQQVFPFTGQLYHHRHYTPGEFSALLADADLGALSWWGQRGPESEVEPNRQGRTVLAVARRDSAGILPDLTGGAPEHVVILGLGPSLEHYVDIVKRLGNRRTFADEVWGINAVGDVIQCDRIFHMDDVRVQEIRAAAKPQSNIAAMLRWLRTHPGPIYTSRAHDGYPGLVEFPLEEVLNNLGYAYFNGTCAYAVALAIHLGVKKISLFGCDFTYANSHQAEKGRACVEFWIGYAVARGIEVLASDQSSLLDTNVPEDEEYYGYDMVTVAIEPQASGPSRVIFAPRDNPPTADEIEARYDHSAHPNRLVRKP